MDNTAPQQPYLDSPTSSRSPSPTPRTSPSSSDSSTTIKPLPPLPIEAPTCTLNEPYRDEPSTDTPYHDEPSPPFHYRHADTPTSTSHYTEAQSHRFENRYTDSPPLTPNDDNIPLAHFLSGQHPTEAPPSYSVAVRSTHTSRDTLIQYIPSNEYTHPNAQRYQDFLAAQHLPRNVVLEIDEETGEVVSRTDDVRHGVEKVVAMFIVAIVLLVLSGVLAWMAFGATGL